MAFAKWPPSIWEQSDENNRLTRSSSESCFLGVLLRAPAFPFALAPAPLVLLAVVDGGGILRLSWREYL